MDNQRAYTRHPTPAEIDELVGRIKAHEAAAEARRNEYPWVGWVLILMIIVMFSMFGFGVGYLAQRLWLP